MGSGIRHSRNPCPIFPLTLALMPSHFTSDLNTYRVKVPPGQTVKCAFGEIKYLHLVKAFLIGRDGGSENENVVLFVKFNNKKLCLGTLCAEKCPRISYNLVFEEEIELSHTSMDKSICFSGYISPVTQGKLEAEAIFVSTPVDTHGRGKLEAEEVGFAKEDLKGEIGEKRPAGASEAFICVNISGYSRKRYQVSSQYADSSTS